MSIVSIGRQIGSVARVGIATIPQRLGASAVVVVGIAGVVGVLVGLLAMGEGFQKTVTQTGTDDNFIFLSAGARSEAASTLGNETSAIVSQSAHIQSNSEGRAMLSPELLVGATLKKKGVGTETSVALRGIGERGWELRPQVKIVSGRRFQSGLHELVVGADIQRQFAGTEIGATLRVQGQGWSVVGVFDSGDAHNSEIWTDTDVLGSAFRRGNGKSSLLVRLTDPKAFGAFKAQLATDPRLNIDLMTTRQYYNRQSEWLTKMSRVFGISIAAVMALGATFGALNTMYSAIATRAREIATLRAIGFRTAPVIVSVMLETMLLAAIGGVLGSGLVWLLFDGFHASTVGSGGQIMFAFDVSLRLLGGGLLAALAIGLVGGLFPAIRAARMPIATALRAL